MLIHKVSCTVYILLGGINMQWYISSSYQALESELMECGEASTHRYFPGMQHQD